MQCTLISILRGLASPFFFLFPFHTRRQACHSSALFSPSVPLETSQRFGRETPQTHYRRIDEPVSLSVAATIINNSSGIIDPPLGIYVSKYTLHVDIGRWTVVSKAFGRAPLNRFDRIDVQRLFLPARRE